MPYAVSKSDCYLIRIHVEVGLCFLGSFEDNLTVFTLWTLVPKTLYRLAGVWFCWPGDSNVITEIQKFDKCKWFTSTLRHMLTAFLVVVFVTAPFCPIPFTSFFNRCFFAGARRAILTNALQPASEMHLSWEFWTPGHGGVVVQGSTGKLRKHVSSKITPWKRVSAGVCWNMSWANRLFQEVLLLQLMFVGERVRIQWRPSECRTSFTRWNWGFSCRNSAQIGCGNHGKWIPKLVK